MDKLKNLELSTKNPLVRILIQLLNAALNSLKDFSHRNIATAAACVSFFAIFSVFPLLAFMVYVVGILIGNDQTAHSAPIVLKILRDHVPAMQTWIEKGLFDVIQNNSVSNWLNAIILGWSALKLFTALQTTMGYLPPTTTNVERSYIGQFLLAICTLFIFALLPITSVFAELASRDTKIPFWMQGLPFELQDAIFIGSKTGVLVTTVCVLGVASLFKLLLPCPLRMRSAILGSLLFSGLLSLSKSAYWIYLHYTKDSIQSTYGIFSNLVLVMFWVHFNVNCLVYSCLFALHFDMSRRQKPSSEDAHEPTNFSKAA